MEILGLLFAVPVTMLSSAAYTALAIWVFGRWPTIKKMAVTASFTVIPLMAMESALLVVLGPRSSYSRLHLMFTILHYSVFLLAPPAIANLILHLAAKRQAKRWIRFMAAAGCCWIACISMLVGNLMVDEAIVGPDAEKPFYMSQKESNQSL